MKYFIRILSLVIAVVLLFSIIPSDGQEEKKEAWEGMLKDGTIISKEGLLKILNEHKWWLLSVGREGKQADLRGADLSNADLIGANLSEANMRDTKLTGAKLRGAKLKKTFLIKADLTGADLSEAYMVEADLRVANLTNAKLNAANLTKADLYIADLSEADLRVANLSEAKMRETNLSEADMSGSNLKKAKLYEADLSKVNLNGANLSEADLSDADLSRANLRGAKIDKTTKITDKWRVVWEIINVGKAGEDLKNADVSEADLSGADLSETDLREAYASDADLSDANLRGSNLREADLSWSDLSGADLSEADLSGADLSKADLSRADLSGANMTNSNLRETNLRKANMSDANLNSVDFREARIDDTTQIADKWRLVWEIINVGKAGEDLKNSDLSGAILSKVDLSGTDLSGSNMEGTDLSEANMSKAILRKVNMSKARLIDVNLGDAIFTGVNLKGSRYEATSSPHKDFLGELKGLTTIWCVKGKESGLVLLRAALRDAGLRNLEREATYTIEYLKTVNAPWYTKWTRLLFFEWISGYGLNYLRPLLILSGMIMIFSFIYIFPILANDKSGIYRVWSKGRIKDKKGHGKPERLIYEILQDNKIEKDVIFFFKVIGYAFYFSLLSTLHIGWRDISAENWITRIQPHEYILKASGGVRVVSGIQSLLSIYLLVMWLLTQFGRPFG